MLYSIGRLVEIEDISALKNAFLRCFTLALCLLWVSAASAQEDYLPIEITAFRDVGVFAGPGDSYALIAGLSPGVPVQLIERNSIGNWLRVQRADAAGTMLLDGWVMRGFMNLPLELRYSVLPVNTTIPDGEPENVDSQLMRTLLAVPVIPTISERMREVFAIGRAFRNQSSAVTKIGDSLSANELYLQPMSSSETLLGPYDYLAETLFYYGASTETPSVAARIGLSSIAVFDPAWADPAQCNGGESPLACEYRLKRPSVAIIMFGPNDVRSIDTERYRGQLQRLVEDSLALGVIPVLVTFSAHPDEQYWLPALDFNVAMTEVAAEYEVPLINLWSAARSLPDYGLDVDRVHLLNSGFRYLKYDTGHESWYGVSLLNLLVLRTLHEIRLTLDLG